MSARLFLAAFLLGGAVFTVIIGAGALVGFLVSVLAGDNSELDQGSELAHELDAMVVAAASEWGFAGLRPHAAIADLPAGVMASTQRYSVHECHIVFDRDAWDWSPQQRREVALHEVGHCRQVLYQVAGGGLSEHNPDPASIMHSPYRPGGTILDSDRQAARPERVTLAGVSR